MVSGKLDLRSPAFGTGEAIPAKYTADGANVSPPVEWHNPPDGTRCFVLICDDPDAPRGLWVHWVVYNIPPERSGLDEGIPAEGRLPDGSLQGRNDFGQVGWGGPSPPRGPAHRYFFRLYAVGEPLDDLGAGATRAQVLDRIEGRTLDVAEHMGTYQRGR